MLIFGVYGGIEVKYSRMTRREMMVNSARAIAGLALTTSCRSFGPLLGGRGFKIGVCDWTIGKRTNPDSLEMAKRFSKAECGARLRFVGWGGHEFGVFGSKWYVENCRDEAQNVKRLLVFDVVGAQNAEPRISVCGGEELQQQVGAYAEERGGVKLRIRTRGGGDASSFVPIGVEAVSIGSASFGRRPPTHSPIDDMRWVGRESLAEYVDIGTELVKEWMVQVGVTCQGV